MKIFTGNKLILSFAAAAAACAAAGVLLLLPARAAFAEGVAAHVSVLSDDGLISHDYLSEYAYTTSAEDGVYISSYSANGGVYGQNTVQKAFDGDWATFWETGRPNADSFINCFSVSFSGEAQIDRIIYSTRQDGYAGRGYPSVLNVYVTDEGGERLACTANSSYGGNRVIISLNGTYSCTGVRLEFAEISSDLKYASAAEFIFLRPEEQCLRDIRASFSDYSMTALENGADAAALRADIEEAKRTVAYECSLQAQTAVDRAEAVLGGQLSYSADREFSTADGAHNPVMRVGDVAGYAQNTLKMVWMGTNRQATGIGAVRGETLTVFVDCDEGDPLPSVVFTQNIGHWNRWRSGSFQLSCGINYITAPDLYSDSWSVATNPGGPLYIVNPYDEGEQSANVRIYIDGGYTFPLYREGEDENAFKEELAAYLSQYRQNTSALNDVCEIVTGHAILTVTATAAESNVIAGGVSLEKVCGDWNEYLISLYEFAGVSTDGGGDFAEFSDPRARYLNVNVRVMQPYAAAYAFSEHVGIQKGQWENTVFTGGGKYGWGFTHELGHMMDIPERTWGEYTNNMWSQFDKCANSGEDARGNFAAFLAATVKDGTDFALRDAYSEHTDAAITWWLIESRYPGFWGRFENNYRYAARRGITDPAELHVYFASLAAGADLSYYFERIGFNWNGAYPFYGYSSASQQFRAAIDGTLSSGEISDEQLKLWYQDAAAYNYTVRYGSSLALYSGTETPDFTLVRSSSGVALLFEEVSDFRHLGYEILRADGDGDFAVIGFTYGSSFTDTEFSEGARYAVRAYDRALGCSSASGAKGLAGASARVNGTDYATLAAAVEAAAQGDVVYLLADVAESGIIVQRDVTIQPLSSAASIYPSGTGYIFNVAEGASLTLSGGQYALNIDGFGISNSEAMIVCSGTLNIGGGVALKNAVNSSANGGAVRLPRGTLNIYGGARFEGNYAANGGAIVSQARGGATINIDGATFSSNSAGTSGGVIYANCYVNLSSAEFVNNSAANGGAVCIFDGGVLTVKDCNFTSNTASSQGGAMRLDGNTSFGGENVFYGNSAQYGGAVYAASSNRGRTVTLSSAQFEKNYAENGGAAYIGGYAALGAAGTSLTVNEAVVFGGSALYIAQGATLSPAAGALNFRGTVFSAVPLEFGADFDISQGGIYAAFTADYAAGATLATFSADAAAYDINVMALSGGTAYLAELSADGRVLAVGQERAAYLSLTDGGYSDTLFGREGESVVLPAPAGQDGKKFVGWQCGGATLSAGESVVLSTGGGSAVAIYEDISDPGITGDGSVGTGPWVYAVAAAAVLVAAAAILVIVYIHKKHSRR